MAIAGLHSPPSLGQAEAGLKRKRQGTMRYKEGREDGDIGSVGLASPGCSYPIARVRRRRRGAVDDNEKPWARSHTNLYAATSCRSPAACSRKMPASAKCLSKVPAPRQTGDRARGDGQATVKMSSFDSKTIGPPVPTQKPQIVTVV